MQFVRHGPDIPERLLQAHEDGHVVFFCGAGISYPAGLPDFSGLAQQLFSVLQVTPNAVQQAAIKAGQFDTAIGLLESGIAGERETVRRALASILTPDLSASNATVTHEALLTLGRNRDGRTRLITTNFDRLFEEVMVRNDLAVERFAAPLLPVPKNHWDGLVYLHGLLSAAPTVSELDRLVVSSGDFGLAYLTERWAARFVSELFRSYTVCFIGYSINDPVLRYMMDALAADRLRGESPPEMFAFGSHSKGKEEQRANEWRAKNVTPILYREHNHHSYLHKTLRAWAATHRDGVRGKERIVVECAIARPLTSTRQDDFVGRMLWALSDPRGLPAKRFADLSPVPSLDWLEPLCEDRFSYADLSRFGVPPQPEHDDKLAFSVAHRPAPYGHAPWMTLVDAGATGSGWDEVMFHLARWLTRHLDDPQLLLWIAKHGGQLHKGFAGLVEHRLEELEKLERAGKRQELDNIRADAPNAVPRPMLRTLWRIVLSGRLRSSMSDSELFGWIGRFKCDGLTTSSRWQLREMLTPRVTLREPFRWSEERDATRMVWRLKDIVNWEIMLSTDHVHYALRDVSSDPIWQTALPDLLTDFTTLLRDTLDLMRELGGVGDKSDLSYMDQPSVSEHPQNRDFHDWTALIGLTRDAWLATVERTPEQARSAAEQWRQAPYPLFKRLAFFAATKDNVIPPRLALDWLLADSHWWLWSVETERESLRLLVALTPNLDTAELVELEEAILIGPPRAMYKDDIEPGHWTQIVERGSWLRLAKLKASGAGLGTSTKAILDQLSAQHPDWDLAADQQDEFPFWMGDAGDWRRFEPTPRRRRALIDWLAQHPATEPMTRDDWYQRCRESFATPAYALWALANLGVWPEDRWRDALQAWSEEQMINRSWRYMGPLLADGPDELFQSLAHQISWWLQAMSKTFDGQDALFLRLCDRVLAMEYQGRVTTDEPVQQAINHPVGHITEALLRWWYRRSLEDGQGLPPELRSIFTMLCDRRVDKFHHGRVLLATHVIALFRVDSDWATRYLLPLFDWSLSTTEAHFAWEGFLWSPRLYRPLMEAIKKPFLDTAGHYSALGKHGEQYAALLTFAALDQGDTYSANELASATRALPSDGLLAAARALIHALEGTSEQRADYWSNRVLPYLRSIWPKERGRIAPAISEHLARLCVAAQEAFPEALEELKHRLQPLQHPDLVVHRLHETNLCNQFPDAAMTFVALVVGDNTPWPPTHLRDCLVAIRTAKPDLADDSRYQRLDELLRRRGLE